MHQRQGPWRWMHGVVCLESPVVLDLQSWNAGNVGHAGKVRSAYLQASHSAQRGEWIVQDFKTTSNLQFKWSAIEDKWTWDDMSINYTSNKEQHLQWASQCANVVYQSSSSLWGFRTFFHSFHAAWNSRIFAPAPFRPPPQSQDPPRRALARGACPWRLRRDVLRSSLMTRGNWKQIQNCQIHIVSWCVCVCMLRAIYAHGCETHIAYSLVYHMYVYLSIYIYSDMAIPMPTYFICRYYK